MLDKITWKKNGLHVQKNKGKVIYRDGKLGSNARHLLRNYAESWIRVNIILSFEMKHKR